MSALCVGDFVYLVVVCVACVYVLGGGGGAEGLSCHASSAVCVWPAVGRSARQPLAEQL